MTGLRPDAEGGWRELASPTLARLLRSYGTDQFDVCEDAVQEALLAAHQQWPDRMPDDPQAWLLTVARRRYVDHVRSDARRRDRETRAAILERPLTATDGEPLRHNQNDDALVVLQLCCHPDLSRSGQVALTLRAVAGLSTRQIANAYQLPESTIAQRLTRAKQRIGKAHKASGMTFPAPRDLAERLPAVQDVLYVMFTEAHHTTSGAPAQDTDLAAEAIRLTRMLRRATPDDSEVAGLLALMLLTEARHPARVGPRGRLVPLDEQDRSRWNRVQIGEGLALLDRVTPGATPGPYLVQACIAGLHASAPDTRSTDWNEIHALYTVLEHLTGGRNPTIALNRIAARSMVDGYQAALADLDDLAAEHPRLPRLAAVRAHLLELSGRVAEATDAYRQAVASTVNIAEQQYLRERLRRLDQQE